MNYEEEYNLRKSKCKYCKKKYNLDESVHDLDCQENCFEDDLSFDDFASCKIEQEAKDQFKNSPYGKQLQNIRTSHST